MKHVKMLGLLVMAAAALMAFASSASATAVLTSPAGTEYTGTIHATLEGTALLKAGIEDTCTESTAHGTVSVNNTEHAKGNLTATGTPPTGLTFGKCTLDTKTITPGSLTIDDKGTVYTENSRVEIKDTIFGITCFYGAETGKVDIGTLTTGTPATLDISTSSLQREVGSSTSFCAEKGTWTGNYKVTTPASLFLT